jgi:hypothetical protein
MNRSRGTPESFRVPVAQGLPARAPDTDVVLGGCQADRVRDPRPNERAGATIEAAGDRIEWRRR